MPHDWPELPDLVRAACGRPGHRRRCNVVNKINPAFGGIAESGIS